MGVGVRFAVTVGGRRQEVGRMGWGGNRRLCLLTAPESPHGHGHSAHPGVGPWVKKKWRDQRLPCEQHLTLTLILTLIGVTRGYQSDKRRGPESHCISYTPPCMPQGGQRAVESERSWIPEEWPRTQATAASLSYIPPRHSRIPPYILHVT